MTVSPTQRDPLEANSTTPSSSSSYWSRLRQDAWQPNWTMTNSRAGLLCLPVIAGWVLLGVIGGQHESAVLAVAGAFTVGFAAFQRILPKRLVPMSITLIGIAVATFLGSFAGHVGWIAVMIVAGVCGYLFGVATTLGYGAWWIGLQCMIGLLVYGAHPSGPRDAVKDAVTVLAGGGSQLLFLSIVLPWTHTWFRFQTQEPFDSEDSLWVAIGHRLKPWSVGGRYALRMSGAMLLAVAVAHYFSTRWGVARNGYWVPMTAAILLKPDRQETLIRGLNRLCGTLAGAGVTTAILVLLRPRHEELGLLLLLAIWSAYSMQRVNYALFATCITSYVVILLSALGLPDRDVVIHRLEATLAGAAIALLVHWMPLESRKLIAAATES